MKVFKYTRTQTVSVQMADEGEDFEGEPVHWDPGAQEESAELYRDQAFFDEDYCEDFMDAESSLWVKQ